MVLSRSCRSRSGLSRSGWVLAALATLSAALLGPSTAGNLSMVAGPDFPQALLAIASLLQLVVASWVLVVIGLSQLRGATRIMQAVTPGVLRRALFVGTVGALALTPAQADRGTSPVHTTAQQHSLDGLRLPDRPQTTTTQATTARAGATQASAVVVRPGDTLWAIAATSLPPGASDADIALACSRWYATNRATIGNDPDLIHPSQRLNPPTKTPPTKDRA